MALKVGDKIKGTKKDDISKITNTVERERL